MEEYFDQECLSIFSAGGLTQPQTTKMQGELMGRSDGHRK